MGKEKNQEEKMVIGQKQFSDVGIKPGVNFQYDPPSGCIVFRYKEDLLVSERGDEKRIIASAGETINLEIIANVLTLITGLATKPIEMLGGPGYEFLDFGPDAELSKKQRQGEIAIACVKYILRKKGFTLNSQIKRELGNVAKELEIDPEELKAFLKPLVQEVLEEALS